MTAPREPLTMGPTARFERLAELFYRETHLMAPGKDVAPEMGGGDYDEGRRTAWEKWYYEFLAQAIIDREQGLRAALAAAHEKVRDYETRIRDADYPGPAKEATDATAAGDEA